MAAKLKFVVPPPEELDAIDSTNLGALSRFKARKEKNQVTAEKASDTDANLLKTVTETIRQENIPTKRKIPHSDSESEINKRQQIEDLLQQNETPNETKLPPKVITKTNSILVNSRQRGNPILKFVRNVPFEYTDIIPDYVMGQTTCALFLSLRYHILKPDYIHERLKQLGHNYKLRVLLVQVDVKDSHHAIKQLTKIAILAKCTLMLAWSPEEAGRFLEIYKVFENKPPDALMGKTETDPLLKLTDAISSVKPVNRTNATSLLTTFKSFDRIVAATPEELSFCPGMGIHKAKKLHAVLNQPFVESKTKNT